MQAITDSSSARETVTVPPSSVYRHVPKLESFEISDGIVDTNELLANDNVSAYVSRTKRS